MSHLRRKAAGPAGPDQPSDVTVDDDGIRFADDAERVVDALFDGRRVWSFWLQRDGEREGDHTFVAWPGALRSFLHGVTDLELVEHTSGEVHFSEEVRFGSGDQRIAIETPDGRPLGLDKSNRLAQTFDTRSSEHVEPLLDSIDEVLAALRTAGIEAFPAYGTLLGAVRGGKLIGHDSDADIGYVSRHSAPVDVTRESFRLQRRLSEMGYDITRYSGAAFKVDVLEADGSKRGLDVFGGFLSDDGHLVLMGEIRTPFRKEWIHPLGETTLEGRTLPAPADPDKFLTATYGPSWRVPDPAYHFETPLSTHRRLNGWFRGTRVGRDRWDRVWSSAHREGAPDFERDPFVEWVLGAVPTPAHAVDIGCGRGVGVIDLAGRGVPAVGLDFSPRGFAAAVTHAESTGLPATFEKFNLLELRQALAFGARLARVPGPRLVLADHLVDNTTGVGREHLWRMAEMLLRDGGRLALRFRAPVRNSENGTREGPGIRESRIRRELQERGAVILESEKSEVAATEDNVDGAAPAGDRMNVWRLVVAWK
ncbi:hypothetical protein ncot_14410 [Nocardioides sp. JQ2195]|uniref:class I SAM-dependent methyltransferase n=1 Tax=Nocardioides sp. JQ2195 TaxID=2592334 RepID=UPI00143E467E|nr:class I SAM-dependent methyltransferase [Nocardioides sp. JQ2195]QIX27655.1 hypothetical protein ncot_14410 [Nocardioides sp. JQ2195]